MVNTGKPSQGCGTCRLRRIKCDERKPTCLRCEKSRRDCTGYRNQLSLRRSRGKGTKSLCRNDSFRTLTQITYSSSSPETVIFSSPLYGISTQIEEECLAHFIDRFVLFPCKGNTRSYMEFIVPAMAKEKSLVAPENSLGMAVMSVAMALFANKRRYSPLLAKAAKEYSRALKRVNEALKDPELALDDQTLATIIVLGLFEALNCKNIRLVGWSSHAEGASLLVKMRAQQKSVSVLGQVLHIMVRSQVTINCFISSTPPPLGVGWWMQIGVKEGHGPPGQASRLNLETAALNAKANEILTEAVEKPGGMEKIIELQTMAQDLDNKFKDWEKESSLHLAWQFSSVAWVDAIEESQLMNAQRFQGRVDQYKDVSIATAWNMMRANRIMLGAVIVRANAWLNPEQDYRITPEFAATAQLSRNLIEDIIASVPTCLGSPPETGLEGRSPAMDRNILEGKSSLALFLLWPLFVINMSDHTTEEQRKWVRGRLLFIAHEVGIQQAIIFSQLNVRVPSMFIYKDRIAKAEGNAIARMKCVELAVSTSANVCHIERGLLAHVLAGFLGCK